MKTEMLDAYLLPLVRDRLKAVRAAEPKAPKKPATDRGAVLTAIAEVQRRLDQLASDYADGSSTGDS